MALLRHGPPKKTHWLHVFEKIARCNEDDFFEHKSDIHGDTYLYLGGGNSNIFGIFTPKIGEDSHFD